MFPGCFGPGTAPGGLSAVETTQCHHHAAHRLTHLRKCGAAGDLRREKSDTRDEWRKTHRSDQSGSAGEESGLTDGETILTS